MQPGRGNNDGQRAPFALRQRLGVLGNPADMFWVVGGVGDGRVLLIKGGEPLFP
jgi:hypothetical protein